MNIKPAILLLSIMAIWLLHGCAPMMNKYENRNEMNIESLEQDSLIGMAREELFSKFGPPLVVVRQGGSPIRIPRVFEKGSDVVSAEEFFKKFERQYKVDRDYVIYYYHQASVYGFGFLIYGYPRIFQPVKNQVMHRIWLLLDDHTGEVIDYKVEKGQ